MFSNFMSMTAELERADVDKSETSTKKGTECCIHYGRNNVKEDWLQTSEALDFTCGCYYLSIVHAQRKSCPSGTLYPGKPLEVRKGKSRCHWM